MDLLSLYSKSKSTIFLSTKRTSKIYYILPFGVCPVITTRPVKNCRSIFWEFYLFIYTCFSSDFHHYYEKNAFDKTCHHIRRVKYVQYRSEKHLDIIWHNVNLYKCRNSQRIWEANTMNWINISPSPNLLNAFSEPMKSRRL